jgi:hypothetical protein
MSSSDLTQSIMFLIRFFSIRSRYPNLKKLLEPFALKLIRKIIADNAAATPSVLSARRIDQKSPSVLMCCSARLDDSDHCDCSLAKGVPNIFESRLERFQDDALTSMGIPLFGFQIYFMHGSTQSIALLPRQPAGDGDAWSGATHLVLIGSSAQQ